MLRVENDNLRSALEAARSASAPGGDVARMVQENQQLRDKLRKAEEEVALLDDLRRDQEGEPRAWPADLPPRFAETALQKAWQDPSLAGVFSSYQINVPQLDVEVDRLKVKRQGVKLNDVFQTLQVNLGSLYVNDFNRFGRTYRVVAQADAPFRSQVEDIRPLKTHHYRNFNTQIVCCFNDSTRYHVAAHDTAKNIYQHCLNILIR